MLKRLSMLLAAVAALLLAAPACAEAAAQPVAHIEITKMMGRWYEVARLPNMIQRGCQAGISEWNRIADGFAVIQSCHKGTPEGPLSEWKAHARVLDTASNAKFKMTFFGGLVSQEYWVLDQHENEGWLILGTHDGKYLWLMSHSPTLPAAVRTEAVARIKQLGFDVGRLEFPMPGHS